MIYQNHQNVNQNVHNCSEKIRIFFKLIRFSTRRYIHYKWVKYCSCALLLWKKMVLTFLPQWFGLAAMGKNHSKIRMLFNLAFLMKCKYYIMKKILNNPQIATSLVSQFKLEEAVYLEAGRLEAFKNSKLRFKKDYYIHRCCSCIFTKICWE